MALVCTHLYLRDKTGIEPKWIDIRARTLDDQTQVDSKPAGQPEHASLNQCQLIAANKPKFVLWSPPAGGGDGVSL